MLQGQWGLKEHHTRGHRHILHKKVLVIRSKKENMLTSVAAVATIAGQFLAKIRQS